MTKEQNARRLLTLSQRHTHAGTEYPAGTALDIDLVGMSESDAQRLVEQGRAEWGRADAEAPAEAGPVEVQETGAKPSKPTTSKRG